MHGHRQCAQHLTAVRAHGSRADEDAACRVGHELDEAVVAAAMDPAPRWCRRAASRRADVEPSLARRSSVRPTAAISGSVNVTRGTAVVVRDRAVLPQHVTRRRSRPGTSNVGERTLPGEVTDCPHVRGDAAPLVHRSNPGILGNADEPSPTAPGSCPARSRPGSARRRPWCRPERDVPPSPSPSTPDAATPAWTSPLGSMTWPPLRTPAPRRTTADPRTRRSSRHAESRQRLTELAADRPPPSTTSD